MSEPCVRPPIVRTFPHDWAVLRLLEMFRCNLSPHILLLLIVLSQGILSIASSIRLPTNNYRRVDPLPYWSTEVPDTLITADGSASAQNNARSIGVRFKPRNTRILAQAVAGTITQAMWNAYEAYGLLPTAQRNSFSDEFTIRHGPDTFDTVVQITAQGNQTGPYVLTNYRMCRVLSLLGYDFSTHINMSNLTEYDFDVVILEFDKAPVVIGRGYMANGIAENTSSVS